MSIPLQGLLPEQPLSVGAEIEHEGVTFTVTEVLDSMEFEHRYHADADDGRNRLWLRHRKRPDSAGSSFMQEVDCLDRVHKARRVLLLPTVAAHFIKDGADFLALERLPGNRLDRVWDDWDGSDLAMCFEQLFLGLSKIHRAGCVVTTLNLESVVCGDDGAIQLVDLSGLVSVGDEPRWIANNVFTSPELEPDEIIDERIDIFSVGAFFASAYLKRVFETGEEMIAAVEEATIVEPVITQLLVGSLSERELRFMSVDEMRILLYQFKNELAGFPRPVAATSSTVGVSRHRYINEDSAGFQELGVQYQSRPQYVGFFCVADGMGGHELGERASQLAVLGALQAFRQLTQEVPFERLQEGLSVFALTIGRAASEVVHNGAQQIPGGARMGTTFTGVLVLNDELAVAHVGDSRALLVRDGELKPITLDHSLVASLVRAGQMTEEEAAVSDERNVLVRCIDARIAMDESGFDSLGAIGIDDGRMKMKADDRVVIVSDGVWGACSDADLLTAASTDGPPQAVADEVVAMAIRSGSDDNATALVLCWS